VTRPHSDHFDFNIVSVTDFSHAYTVLAKVVVGGKGRWNDHLAMLDADLEKGNSSPSLAVKGIDRSGKV
jgi:hypothetical protein